MSDLISVMMEESWSYGSWEKLEHYLEEKKSLQLVPLVPLSLMLKKISPEEIATILPYLSAQQRQCLVDLDAWKKDELEVDALAFWPRVYAHCPDPNIQREFVRSESFLLLLKARINIWTFDQEDPKYPDHDYYFLSDDQLLLFEYDEDFSWHSELQYLIRLLYEELGVEQSYSLLFKLVSDSFLEMQEEEYRLKRERLREFGQVDYYDALALLSPIPNEQFMQHFLAKKSAIFTSLSPLARAQTVPSNFLIAFGAQCEHLREKLEQVTDPLRLDYLRFNLVRLLSAAVALGENFDEKSLYISQVGRDVANKVELGIDYVMAQNLGQLKLFELFDFVDLYRIGQSLLSAGQKKIRAGLSKQQMPVDLPFLGTYWLDFLEKSFMFPTTITPLATLQTWQEQIDTFVQLLPYIATFWRTFEQYRSAGNLNTTFYLNYQIEDIDFEALILSNFANFSLGHFSEAAKGKKLGIDLQDYQQIMVRFCGAETIKEDQLVPEIERFTTHFGLNQVSHFQEYLLNIFRQQLVGTDYSQLQGSDYQYVGGPIIFTPAT